MRVPSHDDIEKRFPDYVRAAYCGWDGPDGWNAVLYWVLCAIEYHTQNYKVDFRPEQYKEKFGTATLYWHLANTDHLTTDRLEGLHKLVEDLVRFLVRMASQTCQACGEYGTKRSINSWVYVMCESCNERCFKTQTDSKA